MESSNSMKSRGYSLRGRTAFSIFFVLVGIRANHTGMHPFNGISAEHLAQGIEHLFCLFVFVKDCAYLNRQQVPDLHPSQAVEIEMYAVCIFIAAASISCGSTKLPGTWTSLFKHEKAVISQNANQLWWHIRENFLSY